MKVLLNLQKYYLILIIVLHKRKKIRKKRIIQATAERQHDRSNSKTKKTSKNDKENKKGEKDTIELDYSNWDSTTDIFNFATLLLDLLNDNGAIEKWLQSNRPCFAFVELLFEIDELFADESSDDEAAAGFC